MGRNTFSIQDVFCTSKRKVLTLAKNDITVLVGKNGYGKSSLLQGIEQWAANNKIPHVFWSDKRYGRTEGMDILGFHEDFDWLSRMAFRSEGQTMLTSITRFFISGCSAATRNLKSGQNQIFLLIDQLDSGLDVHQIRYVKRVLRDTIIPDMRDRCKLDVYVVMTANSYEMVYGEDCVDPNTRKHMTFNTLDEYAKYIDSQYTEEDGEE